MARRTGGARVRAGGIDDESRPYPRARVPLIVLVTVEEQRAIAVLDDVRRKRDADSDLVTWDIADRFESRSGRQLPDAADPGAALDKIREQVTKAPERRDLYVLKDFHEFWERDPRIRRKLRNLAQRLVFTGASLVVTAPVRDAPVGARERGGALGV